MEGVGRLLKPGLHVDDDKFRRFPLYRIQPVLRQFIAAFQLNLDRLQQHRQNIEKCSSDLNELNREVVYAAQSVEQLIITLKQFKQTRFQVEPNDLAFLDLQLMDVLNDGVLVAAQFLVMKNKYKHEETPTDLPLSSAVGSSPEMIALDSITHCAICTDFYDNPRGLPCMHTFCLSCLKQYTKGRSPGSSILCPLCRKDFVIPAGGIEAIPKNFVIDQLVTLNHRKTSSEHKSKPEKTMEDEQSSPENENMRILEQKLEEFYDLTQAFVSLIQHHDSGFRSADASCASTEQQNTTINVSNFKLLLLPVAGAMIGGVIAGPVGLVAGLKAGKMAAVGGSLIGLTGGTLLKHKKTSDRSVSVDTVSDSDSVELSSMRSTSSPAISSCQQSFDKNDETT